MKNRRLVILLALLVVATGVAAVQFWPTPRRRALARIEALKGDFREEEYAGRRQNSVILPFRPVTEEDLAALRDLRPVHKLYLAGSPITDQELAQLAELQELELLDLSATKVTDAGLAHLRGLPHLKGLVLRQTRVTDAGLVHLRTLPELGLLIISRTAVTDHGVEELKKSRPDLSIEHRIEDDG